MSEEDIFIQKIYGFKKIEKQQIAGVEYGLFDFNKFQEKFDDPGNNENIFIYGRSGEGKSMFANLILFTKVMSNIQNKKKTIVSALSDSSDAHYTILKLSEIACHFYPELKDTWDTSECLLECYHTNLAGFDAFKDELDSYKTKDKAELHRVFKLWYLDDIGLLFSDRHKNAKEFFDLLASNSRHYNISCILNSQKVEIPPIVITQVRTVAIIGPSGEKDLKFLINKGSIQLNTLTSKAQSRFIKEINKHYLTSKSFNILLFRNEEGEKCFFFKTSSLFIKMWNEITPEQMRPKL